MDSNYMALLSELLSSSSSSSSSSSDDEMFMFLFSDDDFFVLHNIFQRNESHLSDSVTNFVQDVVANYTDDEFRRHFRMSRQTAAKLANHFASSRHFKNNGLGELVSAEAQCLCFLWFAGNNNTYLEVAKLFNLSLSNAYRNQTAILAYLSEIASDHIKMPSTDIEKENISDEFAKIAGFQNVLGSIDGCHLNIRKPLHVFDPNYVSSQGLLKITLQGICDTDKKFLDIFVGPKGKVNKSEIFKMSQISKNLPQICGVKYHILGDDGYPLREYLMIPYEDGSDLNTNQQKFNEKHSQTRTTIDNCFVLLKQRFRQLNCIDILTDLRMSRFVLGCCVLHNFCIKEGDLWVDQNVSNNPGPNSQQEEETNRGESVSA